MIRIGTSGFDYPDWKEYFYPGGLPRASWLSYYADRFSALELNFSYYRMPEASGLEKMLKKSDGKLDFTIKAHRSMTHERTASNTQIEQFQEALQPLREAGKLAAVLAQFPYSFKQEQENRAYIKAMFDKIGPPLVFEFREHHWAQDPIVQWLSKMGAGYCCVDEPAIKGLLPPQATAGAAPAYVRFHGRNAAKWYKHDVPAERYDYRYSPQELMEWVPRIKQLENKTGNVLVFFNNHFQGKAVDSAQKLGILLDGFEDYQ